MYAKYNIMCIFVQTLEMKKCVMHKFALTLINISTITKQKFYQSDYIL